ncbi:MAG: hypothetical protein JNM13_16315 [Hyphomicrobiaceae bacterium]|nr:hypothetical protein [Hyphomicrobiaceae bacterium]
MPKMPPAAGLTLSALAILLTCLGGCATSSDTGPPVAVVRCPALKGYPSTVGAAASIEARQLGPNSTLAALLSDYLDMRAKCRALEGGR